MSILIGKCGTLFAIVFLVGCTAETPDESKEVIPATSYNENSGGGENHSDLCFYQPVLIGNSVHKVLLCRKTELQPWKYLPDPPDKGNPYEDRFGQVTKEVQER